MIKVGIITFQNGYNRGACDFYPLIKWKRELSYRNIKVNFFGSHQDKKLFKQDVVGVDHRYYRELAVVKNRYSDRRFIVDIMDKLRSKDIKVILFDNGDGAGGRQWDLIKHVDLLVKKQVLKNREDYTLNDGVFSYMPFTRAYKLSANKIESNLKHRSSYSPCPPDQLHKIKLGWNIGMKDYRYFPFSKYYPIGTSRLINKLYQNPAFEDPENERKFDSVFRGKINYGKDNYAYQRNKVVELFELDQNPNLITGGTITKNKYLKELRQSKICVSPFGWGEVCYRDFEAILAGCLLIKPDMEHLETYPNVYKKNETYIPIKWDMSNLEEKLNDAIFNYDLLLDKVIKAQKIYKNAILDGDRFVDHLKYILTA
ncbi:MAG: hypothetical protein GVY07_05475 [Bacteroidetes bacterium]|jgi:hypothetical protein|nr:hypothetical protein [Bacteroidota bacterium]